MIDWNNPVAVDRYKRAGTAYQKYVTASRKGDYKRYTSFDMQKKMLHIVAVEPYYATESYPIGSLLLDFASLDLTEYEAERQTTLALLNDPNTDYTDVGCYYDQMDGSNEDNFDRAYNQRICVDRFIKRFEELHPYLIVFDTAYITLQEHDAVYLLENELNLQGLQREVLRYIELCLNEQSMTLYAKLTPTQRYVLHTQTTERIPAFTFASRLYIRAISGPDAKPKRIVQIRSTKADLERITSADSFEDATERRGADAGSITRVLSNEYKIEEGYAVQTARDMAMLELSRMIMINPRVCICDYCGRWFMPKGKHDAKYCTHIPAGKKSNCQTLGAQRDFVQKTRAESAYNAYRMMYKRLNQRLHKGAMTEKAFREWQGNAQRQLELCRNGEITLEAFKGIIGMK